MPRPRSTIPKFSRVEMKLRTVVQNLRDTIELIDGQLGARRTEEEIAILKSIRAQTAKVLEDARNVLGRLFDEVGA